MYHLPCLRSLLLVLSPVFRITFVVLPRLVVSLLLTPVLRLLYRLFPVAFVDLDLYRLVSELLLLFVSPVSCSVDRLALAPYRLFVSPVRLAAASGVNPVGVDGYPAWNTC